jgi:cell division protein ZapA
MSNVTVTIAGRHYTVACGPGEEDHISMLGASIDGKLAGLEGLANQSEARTLLYAALLLADELHEVQQNGPSAAPNDDGAPVLEALAERLEDLAARLENG